MARQKKPTQQDFFGLFNSGEELEKKASAPDPSKDPEPVFAEPEEPRAPERKVLSVTQLNEVIKGLYQGAGSFWLEGEISGSKIASSGHYYFTLKDDRSQIEAVMYSYSRDRLQFSPGDGLQVLVRGTLTIFRGRTQVKAEYMEPAGKGARQLALEQLQQRLFAEGLFDQGRKRPLPAFPKTVAFVTSPKGAVIRDVKNVLLRRFPCRLILVPALVQGDGAAESIAQGIRDINEYSAQHPESPVDILIVGRGGGSAEDLWCFNEEPVVRAIAASAIPVISAVGHETDTTLADYVADLRAPTPSAAAELAVTPLKDWRQNVANLKDSLDTSLDCLIEYYADRLRGFLKHRALQQPVTLVDEFSQKVDACAERMGNALSRLLEAREARLAVLQGKLSALGPLAVLKRGYALIQDGEGNVLTTTSALRAAGTFTLRLQDGTLKARPAD